MTQPGVTYHDIDGSATETVTYYDLDTNDINPKYTYTPTYYDEDGNITEEVTDNPAYAYCYAYGWVYETNGEVKAIYQAPVYRLVDLEYGSYTVKVIPRYATTFDHDKDGSFKFYVDSVRIYDPCGTAETLAEEKPFINDVYYSDKEGNSQYAKIKTLILSENDLFVSRDGKTTIYSMYIDGISNLSRSTTTSDTEVYEKYKNVGPNNEVYLAKNQSVGFSIQIDTEDKPSTIQLGTKVAKSTSDNNAAVGKLIVSCADATSEEIAINGCTTMYRDISDYVVWDEDYNEGNPGSYKTDGYIVITNTSDTVIAVTNLKYTFEKNLEVADEDAEQLAYAAPLVLTAIEVDIPCCADVIETNEETANADTVDETVISADADADAEQTDNSVESFVNLLKKLILFIVEFFNKFLGSAI